MIKTWNNREAVVGDLYQIFQEMMFSFRSVGFCSLLLWLFYITAKKY